MLVTTGNDLTANWVSCYVVTSESRGGKRGGGGGIGGRVKCLQRHLSATGLNSARKMGNGSAPSPLSDRRKSSPIIWINEAHTRWSSKFNDSYLNGAIFWEEKRRKRGGTWRNDLMATAIETDHKMSENGKRLPRRNSWYLDFLLSLFSPPSVSPLGFPLFSSLLPCFPLFCPASPLLALFFCLSFSLSFLLLLFSFSSPFLLLLFSLFTPPPSSPLISWNSSGSSLLKKINRQQQQRINEIIIIITIQVKIQIVSYFLNDGYPPLSFFLSFPSSIWISNMKITCNV